MPRISDARKNDLLSCALSKGKSLPNLWKKQITALEIKAESIVSNVRFDLIARANVVQCFS